MFDFIFQQQQKQKQKFLKYDECRWNKWISYKGRW